MFGPARAPDQHHGTMRNRDTGGIAREPVGARKCRPAITSKGAQNLRMIVIAAIGAVGVGLAGMSSSLAVPASGTGINSALPAINNVEQVYKVCTRWRCYHGRCKRYCRYY